MRAQTAPRGPDGRFLPGKAYAPWSRATGEERIKLAIDQIIEGLPTTPAGDPTQWNHSELFVEVTRRGTAQDAHILPALSGATQTSLKDAVLIVELSTQLARLLANVQAGELQ
jgi:hypothetical protein